MKIRAIQNQQFFQLSSIIILPLVLLVVVSSFSSDISYAAKLASKPTKAVLGVTTQTGLTLDQRVGQLESQISQVSFNNAPSITIVDTAGGNLLRNTSFEAGGNGNAPSQWNYQLDSTTGNTFLSQEGIHSGSEGLKFLGGGTGNFGISQPNVKTTPQRTYTFSAFVKIINAPSVTFRLGFWDEYNNKEGSFKNFFLSGTQDWKRVSMSVTTTGQITDPKNWYAMIQVQGLRSGNVYLDDVQLTEGSVLTTYNTALATSGTGALALGDGSILGSSGGDLYPAQSGIGNLGTANNKWNSLNLTKATIDANGTLNLSGGLTIGALASGILHSNGSGSITSSAVGLATSDINGTLAVGNGGTGQTSLTANGILYGNGASGIAALTPGTAGYILQTNGSGSAPTWVAATGLSAGSVAFSGITTATNTNNTLTVGNGSTLTTTGTGVVNANQLNGQTTSVGGALTTGGSFTTSGANALTLTTTGATNVTLPTSGTLSTFAGGFNNLTGGTNTNALVIGTGGSLTTSGSGTNNANQLNGQTTSVGGALTTANSFTTAGNFGLTLTTTGTTNVTLPTSGTLSTFGGTFANLAGGTNTTAAMLVGTGASLGGTGTGTITATGADANAAAGALALGTTNAGSLTLGNAGQNTTYTFNGAGTFATSTGTNTLNGNTTIAANKSLTLTSGTGTITQNYSNTTGSATTFAVTNSNAAAGTGVNGLAINLVGTVPSSGTNTNTGINFGNVTAQSNNTFNALTFGTGYTNFVTSPNINITSAGVISGAGSYNGVSLSSTTVQPVAAGPFTFQSNGANAVTLDTGGAATVQIGTGNANAITLGANTTVSANKNLTLASGTGQFSQTYSNTLAGNASVYNITNGNTGVTATPVSGLDLTLTNATNTNNSNTLNGVTFEAASNNNTNVINGINFASATGFTNFLKTPSIVISSAGNISGAGTIASGAITDTSTNANALAVGQNGITNPALNVDTSTGSSTTGLNIKSGISGGGLSLTTLSGQANENLTLDAKGSGTVTINGTATGSITLGRATTITTGGLTVSAGNVSLTSTSTTGTTTFAGSGAGNVHHLVSTQTTLPTESVVTYTAGTVTAGSTDTKGQFTVTTTAATGSVTLLFTQSYASSPICTVSPASQNTQADASKIYVTTATNGLTINYNAAPTANLQTWNYVCIQ